MSRATTWPKTTNMIAKPFAASMSFLRFGLLCISSFTAHDLAGKEGVEVVTRLPTTNATNLQFSPKLLPDHLL